MPDTIAPAADRSEHPDYRVHQRDPGEWVVDAWSPRGWEELPGAYRTKRAAVESTRPPRAFCELHWSWLCGKQCEVV